MSRVAVVAGGAFPRGAYPRYLLQSADRVICCDSALRTYIKYMGRRPDMAIGDFDSLCGRFLRAYDGPVLRVSEQETNDLSKAVSYVMTHWADGLEAITIVGGGGKREDHTIGNVALLMEYVRQYGFGLGEAGACASGGPSSASGASGAAGPSIVSSPSSVSDASCVFGSSGVSVLPAAGIALEMVSDYGTFTALRGSCELYCGKGRTLSFFTCDPTLGVRSEGLQYPLEGVVFDNWWKATLNRSTDDLVRLHFSHPAPALVYMV